jgi:uncharacterized protein (DUF885 family)
VYAWCCIAAFLLYPLVLTAGEANPALHAHFEQSMQARLALDPLEAEKLGDRSRNCEWPDLSEAAAEARLVLHAEQLRALRAFDRASLNDADQLSYDLFELTTRRFIEADQWRHHGYVNHQMYGYHTGIPTHLMNVHRIESVADAEAYLVRLAAIDNFMGQVVAAMRRQTDLGIQPPAFVYPKVIAASENVLRGAPFEAGDEGILLADFGRKVEALELPPETSSALIERARQAMISGVKPGYDRLIAEFKREQATATSDDGVWKLPNGNAYYGMRLRTLTTTDLSAQSIHDLGLEHVERIHGEMREIMQAVGFEGSLQAFFYHLQTNRQFYAPDTDVGRQAYLQRARDITARMEARVPDFFDLTPGAPMEVRRVEPYREYSAGKAFYERASLDGSRPGIFYANLRNMRRMPLYQLEALAYHEGIPGHHFQITIAQELEAVPLFQRTASFTAFIEGWGLYTEELGKDMGFYPDPYSDFGRLAMELWRACRLVVDTGIHDQRWTREQAIDYLLETTPATEAACTSAIERYIVMPGQATAYMIGKLKIMQLRELAMEELGDAFDWRGFHRVVLGSGSVPLAILDANVRAWIAEVRGS